MKKYLFILKILLCLTFTITARPFTYPGLYNPPATAEQHRVNLFYIDPWGIYDKKYPFERGADTYIAFHGDSVYIQCWENGPWIPGVMKNNKIHIKTNIRISDCFDDEGKSQPFYCLYLHAASCERESGEYGSGYYFYYSIKTLDTDIILDYNPTTKTIKKDNDPALFVHEGARGDFSWMETAKHPEDGDIYRSMIKLLYEDMGMIYREVNHSKPLRPSLYVGFEDGSRCVMIQASYYDLNNKLLTGELRYKLHINGKPDRSYDGSFENYFKFEDGKFILRPQGKVYDTRLLDQAYAIIYLSYQDEDGEWKTIEGDKGWLPTAGIGGTAADADIEEQPVYDLTGRRVNRDNLAPGIYISAGRKFTVK